jgi:GDP-L-fucose synthase
MRILVTGAYGMLGTSLRKMIEKENLKENYINGNGNIWKDNLFRFLSSKDGDLREQSKVESLFEGFKPHVVIHLASCVGGVYQNMNNNYTYLMDNTKMHLNILNCCEKYNVNRLINILSTCIFPKDNVDYPLTSDQLHNGLPHESNIGYAYSKRILHLASHLLSQKNKDFKVINITPTNLYGENDNYNLQASHVIPGLIHKVYNAKKNNTPLEVYGSGLAVRQFLYADDLALVIIKFIELEINENENEVSVIVSPPENDEISIKDVVETICNIFEFDTTKIPCRLTTSSLKIVYNTSYSDGQYKKTTNDHEIKKYIPDITFTPLNAGLRDTIKYFNDHYDFVRK